MLKKRIAAILVSMLVFTLVMGVSLYANRDRNRMFTGSYYKTLPVASWESDVLHGIGEDFTVDGSFSTHLPLVIIDTGGIEPPINTEKKLIKGFWISSGGKYQAGQGPGQYRKIQKILRDKQLFAQARPL